MAEAVSYLEHFRRARGVPNELASHPVMMIRQIRAPGEPEQGTYIDLTSTPARDVERTISDIFKRVGDQKAHWAEVSFLNGLDDGKPQRLWDNEARDIHGTSVEASSPNLVQEQEIRARVFYAINYRHLAPTGMG